MVDLKDMPEYQQRTEDWEKYHYKPSELIIMAALGYSGKKDKNDLNDHEILVAVIAWLDAEVGSAKAREE